MPIPAFQGNGLLPAFIGPANGHDRSPYSVSMLEFAQFFGTTPHRRSLIRNLIAYRSLIATDGYTDGLQFLDGSFVEDVEMHSSRPPGDIDVFSFLSIPSRYKADPATWPTAGLPFWTTEIQNHDLNKARFSLDTYAAIVEDFNFESLMETVIYWYGLFSHQRTSFSWKGFLAVRLDPQADTDALSVLGTT